MENKLIMWYFVPVIITMFLFNYHHYRFYEDDFKEVIRIVHPSFAHDNYEAIQAQHPYYLIYQMAKETKDTQVPVIYIKTRQNLDSPDRLKELTVMIDYFFHPRIISPVTLKKFDAMTLQKGEVIISDIDLTSTRYAQFWRLIRIIPTPPQIVRINRRQQDDMFVYKVVK